jgi:ubiquitin-protein ligase
MRKRLRRITEELGALSTSLPLSSDSSILLAVDAQRMDVLRALLLPHPDTPYGGGAFLFDIYLPDNYPDKPPMVSFAAVGMPYRWSGWCALCGLPVALWQRCLPTNY